jgi:hypothetical protein
MAWEIGRTQSLRYLEHQNQRNPDGREKPLRCEFDKLTKIVDPNVLS